MFLKLFQSFEYVTKQLHQRRGFRRLIDVHPKIQRSLQRKEAVVALESTIITHGMPYPYNLETAEEVEALVHQNGAIPATIAIINGRLKVGISSDDLRNLARKEQHEVIKCSRRDLPYLVANNKIGGTTVAATMIIAHMVGIKIFATGGVGGVHRDGHITMDISTDLIELGRTPVTVVSSGIKSILDIPRSLEYLETQGVCVASYGSPNGNFPDFYTPDSGYKVPYNLEGPDHAANVIRALQDLQLSSGMLIGVPIPREYAADKETITAAICQANHDAQEQGIVGKQVTPFLLAAIAKITKGHSLQANMALIKNNASVAAQIARELCRDKYFMLGGETDNTVLKSPFVIGASILDLSLTMVSELPEVLNGATYSAEVRQSAGGVARNIAEGVFKLYGKVDFLSIVGNDSLGKSLLEKMPPSLCENVHKNDNSATSLCTLLFDKFGDCKVILGNMDIHQSITPDLIRLQKNKIRTTPLVVMDSNLSVSTIECTLQLAAEYKRPVFFEPTDMHIAAKPFALPRNLTQQIKIISPNIYELIAIVEAITKKPVVQDITLSGPTNILVDEVKKILLLIKDLFDCILVTLGAHGAILCLKGADFERPLFEKCTGDYLPPSLQHSSIRFYTVPKVEKIVNVSGAGDSFSSGFITGLLRGFDVKRSVGLAFLAAERALQTSSAVPTVYFKDNDEELKLLEKALGNLKEKEI